MAKYLNLAGLQTLWTKAKNTFLGKNDKAASAVLADRSKEINVITACKDSSIASEAYMPVIDDMFFGASSYSDCIFHIQGVYKKLADSAQPKNVNFDLEFGWRTDSNGNPNTGFCYMYSPYDISSLVGFRLIVWRDTGNNVSKGRLYVVNKDTASGIWSRVELSVIHKTGDASWKQSTSSTWVTDKPSSTVAVDSTFTKVLVPSDIRDKEDKSNKVTAWSTTTTDTNYPSEKLVKDALDGKAGTSGSYSGLTAGIANKLNYPDGRTATANINDTSRMKLLLASSAMTTGKPSKDGYIMHFNWDSEGFASQLFIPADKPADGAKMLFRQRNNFDVSRWDNWGALPADITGNAATAAGYTSNGAIAMALNGKADTNDQNVRCLNLASDGNTRYYKVCDISMQVNGAQPQLFAVSTRDGGDANSSGILCLRLVSYSDHSRADSLTVFKGKGYWNGVRFSVKENADSSWTVYAQLTAWCALSIRKLSGNQTVTWSGGSATEALYTAGTVVSQINTIALQDGNYSGMTVGTATTASQLIFGSKYARVNIGTNNVITFEYKDGSNWKTATLGSPVSGVASSAEYANRAGETEASKYLLANVAGAWDGANVENKGFVSYSSASSNKGYFSLQGGKQAWIANADYATSAGKATADINGNNIVSTYATSASVTAYVSQNAGRTLSIDDNRILSLKSSANSVLSSVTIPGTNVVFGSVGSANNTIYCV